MGAQPHGGSRAAQKTRVVGVGDHHTPTTELADAEVPKKTTPQAVKSWPPAQTSESYRAFKMTSVAD